MSLYLLSKEAELDLEDIAEYTLKNHGEDQLFKYIGQLERDTEQLALGNSAFKDLGDIHPKLRVKKSGKHYIFGIIRNNAPMLVIAIYHERMKILQRLKGRLA